MMTPTEKQELKTIIDKECDEDINIERLKLLLKSEYCVKCMNELGL